MYRTLRAARFLFIAPLILLFLVLINLVSWHGHWWVQWAALGLGIAWVISLIRVLKAAALVGGVAALTAILMGRRSGGS